MLSVVLPAVLALVLLGLTGCDRDVEIDPPKPPQDTTAQRAEEAQQALDGLVSAVRSGTRDDAVATAAEGSEDLLGEVFDNADALRVGDLSLRYVDEGTPLDHRQQVELRPGAWRGTVQMTYGYNGVDETPARLETEVAFVPEGDRAGIASFGATGARTPLWLTGPLSVVRTPRSVVAVAGPTAGRYPRLVAGALKQVAKVLPEWKGPLLVEVPDSGDALEAALKSQPGQYDNIAAVTTTADGSLAPGAPVRVFVNPAVFGRLKERGAQVVMSHEATHVATGATFATMPTWLLEGFADYVALDRAGVPVDLAAGQILARIRKDGLPDGLPSAAELDPSANGLGATYEEAWLACRFLAEEHGADAMVRFYETVSDGGSTKEAFRTVLGTSEREFVARWRADLRRLAGLAG